jgi:hypothetical protein
MREEEEAPRYGLYHHSALHLHVALTIGSTLRSVVFVPEGDSAK